MNDLNPNTPTGRSTDQPWALCWSQSQCALHIEPLADMLSENRSAYTDDRRMDYVPIHIGPRNECEKAAASARLTLYKRQEQRGANG